jgi:hypothetical protein
VNRITAATTRLEAADTLPGLLDAAYDAFEDILALLRHHQDHADGALPAFVIAAAAAGNGRDCIADAPSLPPAATPARPPATPGDLMADASVNDVALALTTLSTMLATTLNGYATIVPGAADRASCEHAARHAARISSLLGWARPA